MYKILNFPLKFKTKNRTLKSYSRIYNDIMNYLKIISYILLIVLIACEYYGLFSNRLYVFSLARVYLGMFQQCISGKCVWFDKDTFDRVSGYAYYKIGVIVV